MRVVVEISGHEVDGPDVCEAIEELLVEWANNDGLEIEVKAHETD